MLPEFCHIMTFYFVTGNYVTLLEFHYIIGILFCYQNSITGNISATQGIHGGHRYDRTNMANEYNIFVTITSHYIGICKNKYDCQKKEYFHNYNCEGINMATRC